MKLALTNKLSEEWHNCFRVVVGKKHLGLYNFIEQLQKDQGDTETMQRELSLGRPIKQLKLKKQRDKEQRLQSMVNDFEDMKANG